jgi:hypothetical protein
MGRGALMNQRRQGHYSIEQGGRSTRMNVRGLGRIVEGRPADRVDIIPQSQ